MTEIQLQELKLPKQLIMCPTCERNGKREILGEIIDGKFKILRFHRGSTIIESPEFQVECGVCGDIPFQRIKQWEKK